jgi:hypothetical protein
VTVGESVVAIKDGKPGTATKVPVVLQSVACWTASDCAGVGFSRDQGAVVVPITGGVPRPRSSSRGCGA